MVDNVEKKNNSELTSTTADELLGLKKGLASEIVDKMLEKNPDLAPFFLKGSVTNYLVDDGSIKDYLRDEIIIKGLGESTGLLTITPTLEKIRNMFSKADTKSKLEKLKVDVFSELGFSEQSVGIEQVPNSTTNDASTGPDGKKVSSEGNSTSSGGASTSLEGKHDKSSEVGNLETAKIDDTKIDKSGFTPGPYPFKHIKTPYKGIESYRVDHIKLDPLIGFSQLGLKGTEGSLTTLKVRDEKERFSKKTAGYKKNNPCNVSPFEGDVGRSGSSKVADGQNHSKYNSMEDGLASFMRLMRQDRYRNKSIQGINCSGMQGIYKPSEPDSLKALRIMRITHACEHLHVSPFQRLNTDDKETMMAWAQETAIRESGSHFGRETLEKAYKKAFG